MVAPSSCSSLVRFNSTLVRFKLTEEEKEIREKISFNSTLVRFKLFVRRGRELEMMVSIPLWFDSNQSRFNLFEPAYQFQFHSGSIQTQIFLHDGTLHNWFQFHSGSIQTSHSAVPPAG